MNGIVGGMLCLLMGLGKTLSALYHVVSSQIENKEEFPTLIVVSKTLLYEWRDQGILKFFNGVKALYYHKDILKKSRYDNISFEEMKKHHFVLTTYDACLQAFKKGEYKEKILEYGEEGLHKDK